MSKEILISIKPEWVAKIFNGDKTAEIRRTAPKEWKDYLSGKTKIKPKPMTGYIYCSKGNVELYKWSEKVGWLANNNERDWHHQPCTPKAVNGKVVAKFTLREVEEICIEPFGDELSEEEEKICSESCLSLEKLVRYLREGMFGYAWHISDLQIFDEPKEITEFQHPFSHCGIYCDNNFIPSFCKDHCSHNTDPERLAVWCDRVDKWGEPLEKAPQSWCYVEVRKK